MTPAIGTTTAGMIQLGRDVQEEELCVSDDGCVSLAAAASLQFDDEQLQKRSPVDGRAMMQTLPVAQLAFGHGPESA